MVPGPDRLVIAIAVLATAVAAVGLAEDLGRDKTILSMSSI